ncbi:hypothetical protein ES703_75033 [subsurface metagenome]
MVHDFYPAVSRGNFVGNLAGGVGTAVVNDNYFKVGARLFQNGERLFDGAGYIVLFIIAGEKNADRIRRSSLVACGSFVTTFSF